MQRDAGDDARKVGRGLKTEGVVSQGAEDQDRGDDKETDNHLENMCPGI